MDKPDLKKLPDYVKNHQTYRAIVEVDSDTDPISLEFPNAERDKPENSNLIGSLHQDIWGVRYHRPLLDIDFPADLIPSTTPGHNHLYINADIPEGLYEKMLEGLAASGLIQQGFLASFQRNRQTTLRLPGVKKAGDFEKKIAKGLGNNRLTENLTLTQLQELKSVIQQAIDDKIGW